MSNTLDKIAEVPQRLIAPETLPTLILGGGFTGLFTALHLSRQHYWTTGIVVNPLIDTLSIPEGGRDQHGRLKLTDTLELLDFPEVFAGGDCAVMENPLPLTAQVAYQQGATIAHNLQALSEGHSPIAVEIEMRGTLMKLGVNESVAELFDRYEVQGHLGHLIRQAAYIELLPTPARNFKETIEWISDELFQRCAGV